MRAAASISNLVYKDPSRKAIEKFQTEFLPRYVSAGITGKGINLNDKKVLDNIITNAAQKLPEIKEVIEKKTRLSGALSRAYMAMISAADTY